MYHPPFSELPVPRAAHRPFDPPRCSRHFLDANVADYSDAVHAGSQGAQASSVQAGDWPNVSDRANRAGFAVSDQVSLAAERASDRAKSRRPKRAADATMIVKLSVYGSGGWSFADAIGYVRRAIGPSA